MNVTNSLIFNGQELTALGGNNSSVVVRKNLDIRPQRRVTKILIPGRNGAQYVDDGFFENVTISYTFVFTDYSKCDDLVNYLLAQTGFNRLEDQYDPDIYRMARVNGVLNPVTPDDDKGFVVVNFECQPERFLKTKVEFTLPESGLITSAKCVDEEKLCRKLMISSDTASSRFMWVNKWIGNRLDLFTKQGYLTTGGEFASNPNGRCTEYIAVEHGQDIPYALSTNSEKPIIAWYDSLYNYDESKSVIGDDGTLQGTYTVPADGYIRASYRLEYPDVYFMFDLNLSDFGLVITGTPNTGDVVTVYVSNPSILIFADSNAHDITNPTLYDSKPKITYYQESGAVICESLFQTDHGGVWLSDYVYDIDTTGFTNPQTMTVDSDKEDCIFKWGGNANPYITFNYNKYPVFAKNKTTRVTFSSVSGTKKLDHVEIEPRWWKI